MKKLERISLILVMMSLFLCLGTTLAQGNKTDYPKILAINGDTVVAITLDQVDSINITYNMMREFKEYNAFLNSSIIKYEKAIKKSDEAAIVALERLMLCEQTSEQYQIIEDKLEDDVKTLERKNGIIVTTTKILTAAVVILTTAVILK